MGFTPLEGLVMGTRSGDLDPALPLLIAEQEGMAPAAVEALLNRDSGLLGLSGRSADLREIEAGAAAGDAACALALDVFCYRIVKYVGGYATALGGLDALLFGGGIGEHSALVRARVCAAMAWAGLSIDAGVNEAAAGGTWRLTAANSRIEAWVIAVDEEDLIARDVFAALDATPA
jgi:acetate kinase